MCGRGKEASRISPSCGRRTIFALTWEELTFHGAGGKSWFNLDQHKNVNKGIKARGGLTVQFVDYLLSIRPKNARGLIHPNPATGKAYTDIRKQWKRLLSIAERMLGYKLTGKQSEFFNFRHSGASHIAARARREAPHGRRTDDGRYLAHHRQRALLQH